MKSCYAMLRKIQEVIKSLHLQQEENNLIIVFDKDYTSEETVKLILSNLLSTVQFLLNSSDK